MSERVSNTAKSFPDLDRFVEESQEDHELRKGVTLGHLGSRQGSAPRRASEQMRLSQLLEKMKGSSLAGRPLAPPQDEHEAASLFIRQAALAQQKQHQEVKTTSLTKRLGVTELLRQARVAIMAAKSAYHFKSDRWLSLVSEAMGAIERCPDECRPRLMRELCAFHPAWRKRPRLR